MAITLEREGQESLSASLDKRNTNWETIEDFANGALSGFTEIDHTDSPYTVLATDRYIKVNAFSAAVEILFPASAGAGRIVSVAKADSSTNTVTLTPDGSETFGGFGEVILTALNQAISVQDTGDSGIEWSLIGSHGFTAGNNYVTGDQVIAGAQVVGDGQAVTGDQTILNDAAEVTQSIEAYSATASHKPVIRLRRARGDAGTPADVQASDELFEIVMEGRDAGAWAEYFKIFGSVYGLDQDALSLAISARKTDGTLLEILGFSPLLNAVTFGAGGAFALPATGDFQIPLLSVLTALHLAAGSPAQITGNQASYDLTDGSTNAPVRRLSTDASRSIFGFATEGAGALYVLINVGSQDCVISNESGSAGSAAQRTLTSTGADVTMTPNAIGLLWRDFDSDRWRFGKLF